MKGLPKIPKIRGNTDPATDGSWKLRGDMHNGKPVYVETVPNEVRRPVMVGGKEVWQRHPVTGEPIRQRFELVVEGTKEVPFVLEDLGNGIVQKNFAFEPAPGEVERREAAANATPFDPNELMKVVEAQQKAIAALQAQLSQPSDEMPNLDEDAGEEAPKATRRKAKATA